MSGECVFLNPLRRDGVSQRQRMVAALDPAYAKVDDRELPDLLLYLRQYAQLLRFYSASNSPAGDWLEFLDGDVTTLVAVIHDTDYQKRRDAFQEAIGNAGKVDLADRPAAYEGLFGFVFIAARAFDDWYRGSVEGLSLQTALERSIGSSLAEALQIALSHARRAGELGLQVDESPLATVSDIWGLAGVQADPSLFPSGSIDTEQDLNNAIERLSDEYEKFYQAQASIVDGAHEFLDETLDSYPAHEPHMTLLLAFLRLFDHARQHLNGLTARHLDFYYKDVLGLAPNPEAPDKAHIIVELAKSFASHSLGEDTYLKAGKDANGAERLYATDTELVANRARVDADHGLKTIFVDKSADGVIENVYAATDADSADGKGDQITDEDGKWATFGATFMPYATIGFAIASPMFLLAEGTRTIWLTLRLSSTAALLAIKDRRYIEAELKHNVDVQLSGQKEWLSVDIRTVTIDDGSQSGQPSVQYELFLGPEVAAVVAYNKKELDGGFGTPFPVLRFVLDNEGLAAEAIDLENTDVRISDYSDEVPSYPCLALVRFEGVVYEASIPIDAPGFRPPNHPSLWREIDGSYSYKYFLAMDVVDLDIRVRVSGLKGAILESDVGLLDAAKPFYPFGPVPRVGSGFLIGSHEVFQKSLTELRLAVKWADLPATSFATHYREYTGQVPTNASFTATVDILEDGKWTPLNPAIKLFDTLQPPDADAGNPDDDRIFNLPFNEPLPRDPRLAAFARFNNTLRQGFLRLSLNKSFLHAVYPKFLAQAASGGGTIPNPPYTPLLASLDITYDASESDLYSQQEATDFENRVEQVFQVWPFGHREIYPVADDPTAQGVPVNRTLVPQFNVTTADSTGAVASGVAEGTLYVGAAELKPAQNLSVLFQVAEGSEDPEAGAQDVVWSYLTGDGWEDFLSTEIVTDGTNGLLQSGVIQFAVPKTVTDTSTRLPSGLHWIKGSVLQQSAAIPRMIAVEPQAVVASFRNNGNDLAHLADALPAETIGKLKSREAAIKSVRQPYASFGGRSPEADDEFYTRVSETLRHKGRAVTIFDYERLVLQNFPEVYKAKCVNHTSGDQEHAPGHVRMVVVPNLRNKNAVDPFQPRLSLATLESIREYLADIASDFVTIAVTNPNYEEIAVRFDVRFQPGRDKGFYTTQLNTDIVRFLAPWLYDEAADLTLGGTIHRSAILNHIEEREYVDFVVNFQMDHVIDGQVKADIEEATASCSSAALVSAREHTIGHDAVSCEDRAIAPTVPAPTLVEESAPVQDELPTWARRYLGNVNALELHDLTNRKSNCQIPEIKLHVHFARIDTALEKGYDYCAWCFSRELSQR